MTQFAPLNENEHNKAKAGHDVPDYCRYCGYSFMDHTNGECPKPSEIFNKIVEETGDFMQARDVLEAAVMRVHRFRTEPR